MKKEGIEKRSEYRKESEKILRVNKEEKGEDRMNEGFHPRE